MENTKEPSKKLEPTTKQETKMKAEYKGKKSIVIYPAYINSKYTVARGRRIATNRAVENPTFNEIGTALTRMGLPIEFEVRAYIAT